ncbi:unnamed protein product [Didymodactylos carnosus]|uniref:Uncharacterized protein n=1 Tax=Didymodactylos carnosus TaxID=1234261 RepID=A0A814Z223_9BILA|nr:unnamed protein product [Didymodactylos carnosus]CAF4000231.1 unnamed protein product [Didymodactylos carnosus]
MDGINERIVELLSINYLPAVESSKQIEEIIRELDKDTLEKLNAFTITWLQVPVVKILRAVNRHTENILMIVQKVACSVWNRFNQKNQIDEHELEFLNNVGQLNIMIVDAQPDNDRGIICGSVNRCYLTSV